MGKIFRVFFSSTFSDFVEERNALQREVFPQLKELCAAHSARFQPIDLRWGIPNEVALQQSTMQICLEEIKRCQDLTPRPNFLVLLGERYGWTPPPAKIPKTEYDLISVHFSEKDKIIIEEWYRHDENMLCKLEDGTITTVYELQPRGEKYENYKTWEPLEIKLRDVLLQAARKATFSENEMVKYYASATHQEIVMGALETHEADKHVHCFFRKLKGLPDGAKSDVYLEPESEKIKLLSNLKEELEHQKLLNIHKYEVDLGDENDKKVYLEKFCNGIYDSLETTILQELDEMEEISALDEEINAHIEFGKERTKVFVGREDILNHIIDYVDSDNRAPFVIYGEPGSGKSALMAKALEKLEKERSDAKYIVRFIGTTPSSSSSIALLRSICEEIINKFEIELEEEIPFEESEIEKEIEILRNVCEQIINKFEIKFEERIPFGYKELKDTLFKILNLIKIPFNYLKLKDTLWKILNLKRKRRRAVILLDALDQLPKIDKGRDFMWFPQELPENVKLITSFATDDTDIMSTLEKKLPSSLNELKRLSREKGEKALDVLLKIALRRLTSNQRDMVLHHFSENGLPLYLKLAFEETCTWNSYDDLDCLKLAPDIEGLIQILFERLYKEHTQQIVETTICYIVAARNGLTEDEILDVISSDLDFFNWYKIKQIHHDLPEEKLPWIVWSRLHFDLEPYLTTRGVDKTSTVAFFHRQFNEAVKRNLLSKMAEDRHQVLASYFNNIDLYYQKNGVKTPNYRKLSELVYNLRKAKMWKILQNLLTSLEFIEAKCTAEMTEDLLIDYKQSLDDLTSKDMHNNFIKVVQEFKQFVFNQAHILQRYPHLTVQQALNQPDSTLPSKAGKDIIKFTDFSRQWIEWVNKPQGHDPCILTFVGHSGGVAGCVFSPDGTKVVSASGDKTLKLWDVESGAALRTFTGHSEAVSGCAFSPDGTRVLSASRDETLKLWDAETGTELRTFTGHSGGVAGCVFSPDGTKVVSASGDKTLKLWDVETGAALRTFTGHSEYVNGCAFSPDCTKVVSASGDNTLKLWDVESGAEIRTFTGHTSDVEGCAFSPDGTKVVSASYDSSLKLWDVESGTEISTFVGHSYYVDGCGFSPDGKRVVSASLDRALKLWDAETGAEIRTFIGHSGSVLGCAFSPDGTKVVSASTDNTLKLWDIETGDEIRTFTGQYIAIWGFNISPDGKEILSIIRNYSKSGGTMSLRDFKTGVELKKFPGIVGDICAFSPDGTRILSQTMDYSLELWDVKSRAKLKTFEGHIRPVPGCDFSPDGKRVVSASFDKTLKLWDAETGVEIRTFTGHSRNVNRCAFSPDGTKVVSASFDKTLKLWDVETGAEIQTFTGHTGIVHACVISPDGKKLLSSSVDDKIKLWDLETGTEIRTFIGHSNTVIGYVFLPDGTKVVSTSFDETLKLWNSETGDILATFPTSGGAFGVVIGPNNLIIVGDSIGWIYKLKLHGIEFGPAIVTPIKLFNFKKKSFEKRFSINCKWCRKNMTLDNKIAWKRSEDHPKGRLGELIECRYCHKLLKLTSFVVGHRK